MYLWTLVLHYEFIGHIDQKKHIVMDYSTIFNAFDHHLGMTVSSLELSFLTVILFLISIASAFAVIGFFYDYLKFGLQLVVILVVLSISMWLFVVPVWVSAYQVEIITIKKIDLKSKVNFLHEKLSTTLNSGTPNEQRTTKIVTVCPIRALVGDDKLSFYNHCYWNRNVTFKYYRHEKDIKSEKTSELVFDVSKSKFLNYYTTWVGEVLRGMIYMEYIIRSIPICTKSPIMAYPSVLNALMGNSTEGLTPGKICASDGLVVMDWIASVIFTRYDQ